MEYCQIADKRWILSDVFWTSFNWWHFQECMGNNLFLVLSWVCCICLYINKMRTFSERIADQYNKLITNWKKLQYFRWLANLHPAIALQVYFMCIRTSEHHGYVLNIFEYFKCFEVLMFLWDGGPVKIVSILLCLGIAGSLTTHVVVELLWLKNQSYLT